MFNMCLNVFSGGVDGYDSHPEVLDQPAVGQATNGKRFFFIYHMLCSFNV